MGMVRIRHNLAEFHRRANGVFELAADLSGSDSALLAGVAQHFLYDLDYEKAAKYYERLLNLHPSMRDNFVICRHCATCLQKIAPPLPRSILSRQSNGNSDASIVVRTYYFLLSLGPFALGIPNSWNFSPARLQT
jgi:hypothetical protein